LAGSSSHSTSAEIARSTTASTICGSATEGRGARSAQPRSSNLLGPNSDHSA
jgi:hypothetical protein